MNPEIKSQWLEALKSGKYKKGKSVLRSKKDEFFFEDNVASIPRHVTKGTDKVKKHYKKGQKKAKK